jgi:hypothetical protein
MPLDIWFAAELVKRVYDATVSYGAPYNSDTFVQAYSDASKKAVDLLGDVRAYTPQQLLDGARGVLRLMSSVVTAYHADADIRINANYMVPIPATPEVAQRARFCTKDRRHDSFLCFLELKRWSNEAMGFPEGLLLPVERTDQELSVDAILMGAPSAFAFAKAYLVNDTLDIWQDLSHHENQAVRSEVAEYFKRHKDQLRSFISFPVTAPADRQHSCLWQTIAVVNIQSNKPRLMGWFPGNRRKLELALAPLLQTFSHFVVRLHYDLAADGNLTGH